MKSIIRKICLLFLVLPFGLSQVSAQATLEKDWDSWQFNVSPYFWFVGITGTMKVPPFPSQLPEPEQSEIDIDIGFKEVRNSIKYAMMLSGQYRNENISVVMNYSHLILEGEAITPLEIVVQGIDIHFRHVSGDISIQYRFLNTPKWNIDAGLGVKLLSDKVESVVYLAFDSEFDLSRSEFWADPILSGLVKFIPHPKLEIAAYLDFGSSLIGDRSYQTIAGITYRFTPLFYISAGYRVWGVRSDLEEGVFTGNLNGVTTRIGFRF